MRNLLFYVFACVVFSCKDGGSAKQKNIEVEPHVKQAKSTKDGSLEHTDPKKDIEIGYADTYEKLPQLIFEEISENEFLSLSDASPPHPIVPEQNQDFFYIHTASKKHRFPKYRDYGDNKGWSGFEYVGYYPDCRLFAIRQHWESDNLGFSELSLWDEVTDYRYRIVSWGDGAVEPPLLSPNHRYLVYYYNQDYEFRNSDIGILKINDRRDPRHYLTEYASFHSTEFAVEKIVWKTGNSFLVKGYQEVLENEKWTKKYRYYMTKFD